jgi:phosphoribosylformylglycinamidine synthase
LCSKRWIYEQYDYMVRTNTTAPPGGDAAVIRVKEAGVSLAMALDGNGRYCSLDPREGAKLAVAECCRNLAAVGAEPIGATNCLNFGNPEKPEIMAQLIEAIEGMGEACRHFETPITGGNVSLYNETLGQAIDPTPVIGLVGLLSHVNQPIGSHFRRAGRALVLIGGWLPGCEDEQDLLQRFGSSQYAKEVVRQVWGLPPALDLEYEKRVQEATREVVRAGLAESAHDVSDGGLAAAVAECCFGPGRVGARVELARLPMLRHLLFHEAPSRVLLSVAPEKLGDVQAIAVRRRVEAPRIGETQPDWLRFERNGQAVVESEVEALYRLWDEALEKMLQET